LRLTFKVTKQVVILNNTIIIEVIDESQKRVKIG